MKNKIVITFKTIILIVLLILGVLLPNLVFSKHPKKSFASSDFSSTIETKLGTVTLKTNNITLKKGDIVPIEIYLGGKNINGLNGNLNYDKEIFQKIDTTTDIDTLSGWGVIETAEDDLGDGIMFFPNDVNNVCSNSLLATIYLKLIADTEKTDISLDPIYICNTDYEDNIEDGELPGITLSLEKKDIVEPENPNPEQPDNPEEPEKTYTITYNANTTEEVKDMPEEGRKTEGKNYTIFGIEPSIVGYTFEGWNTIADGTGTAYKTGSIYTNDENLTLYAQWKEVPKLQSLYLSSETYKIGNIDITKYQEGDKYISRVEKETMLIDYINNLTTNGEIEVINAKGEKLQDEDYVGTGMTLIVTKGQEKIELKIAVMGDLSGEGAVTAQDYSEINRALLGTNALENEFMIAGDTSEDGKITASDFSDINKMVLRIL